MLALFLYVKNFQRVFRTAAETARVYSVIGTAYLFTVSSNGLQMSALRVFKVRLVWPPLSNGSLFGLSEHTRFSNVLLVEQAIVMLQSLNSLDIKWFPYRRRRNGSFF